MAVKMEKLLAEARAKGLDVEAKITREDGWKRIRVTSINGRSYDRSEGNSALRKRMGAELSSAEKKSRHEANVGDGTPAGAGFQRARHKGAKNPLPKLTKGERSAIAKANRAVKKTGQGTKISYHMARKLKARGGHRAVADQAKRHYLASKNVAYADYVALVLDYAKGEEEFGPRVSLRDVIAFLGKFVRSRKNGAIYNAPHQGLDHDLLAQAHQALYNYHKIASVSDMKEKHDYILALLKKAKREY